MDSTNPNSNPNSTRPSRPPRPHSLSLPAAVPFPSDASHISSQLGLPDPFTRNRTSLLSRIHSDTSPATRFHTSSATGHTHRHHSSAADEPRTHPLHRASTAALDVSRPAPRRTHSLQQQQHPSASANGESQGLSSGPRAAIAAERKRRLEAIATSPARRTGSGVVEMQRGEREGGLGSGRGQVRLFQGPGPGPGSEVGSAIDSAGAGEGMAVGDGERRRESEIRLPRWQPDEEVSKCPVCGVGFTFWFRKHHCRKCGTVVCANCSPHRITIPRQFIVHPPSPTRTAPTSTATPSSTSTPADRPSSEYGRHQLHLNPALGGGEEVRVCNPCVPDPNYDPPPSHVSQSASPFARYDRRLSGQEFTAPSVAAPQRQPGSMAFDFTRGMHGQPFTSGSTHRHSTGRIEYPDPNFPPPSGQPSRTRDYGLVAPRFAIPGIHFPTPSLSPLPALPGTASQIPSAPRPRHAELPYSHSSAAALPISTRPHTNNPLPAPPPPPSAARPPRREIAEEDECPVCGLELPPKDPNGTEAAREQHVEACIDSHFLASSSSTTAPIPTPSSAHARTLSAAVPSASSAPSANPAAPAAGGESSSHPSMVPQQPPPLRRRAGTGSRMLVYRATEKDCLGDEEGVQAECVICFEELEVGVEMARLECLCRFHKACIRRWWETKGAGSCPTHQLHD